MGLGQPRSERRRAAVLRAGLAPRPAGRDTRQALDCLAGLRCGHHLRPRPGVRHPSACSGTYAQEVREPLLHEARLEEHGGLGPGHARRRRPRAAPSWPAAGPPTGSSDCRSRTRDSVQNALSRGDDGRGHGSGDGGAARPPPRRSRRWGRPISSPPSLACLADALVSQGRDRRGRAVQPHGRGSSPTPTTSTPKCAGAGRERGCWPDAERSRRPSTSPGEALDLVAATDALNDHASTLLDLGRGPSLGRPSERSDRSRRARPSCSTSARRTWPWPHRHAGYCECSHRLVAIPGPPPAWWEAPEAVGRQANARCRCRYRRDDGETFSTDNAPVCGVSGDGAPGAVGESTASAGRSTSSCSSEPMSEAVRRSLAGPVWDETAAPTRPSEGRQHGSRATERGPRAPARCRRRRTRRAGLDGSPWWSRRRRNAGRGRGWP